MIGCLAQAAGQFRELLLLFQPRSGGLCWESLQRRVNQWAKRFIQRRDFPQSGCLIESSEFLLERG